MNYNRRENMTTIYITGNTYRHKDALKARGWKWTPDRSAWRKDASDDLLAAAIRREDGARQALAQAVGGNLKECMIYALDGWQQVPVWTANSYAAWAAAHEAAMHDER
jgi:hypothetical protein